MYTYVCLYDIRYTFCGQTERDRGMEGGRGYTIIAGFISRPRDVLLHNNPYIIYMGVPTHHEGLTRHKPPWAHLHRYIERDPLIAIKT